MHHTEAARLTISIDLNCELNQEDTNTWPIYQYICINYSNDFSSQGPDIKFQ